MPPFLHIRGLLNSQYIEGLEQLLPDIIRQPEEDCAALEVFFRDYRLFVVEVVERLGELEGIFRNMGGFSRLNGAFNDAANFRREKGQLPKAVGFQVPG